MKTQSVSRSVHSAHPAEGDTFSQSKTSLLKSVASSWFSEPTTRFWNLLCFSAAMLVVVLYGPFATHEHTLADLMAMRFSGANLLAGGTCILVWHVLLNITRLPRRSRNLGKHLLGLALQTIACTGPAGLLLLFRHKNMAAASFVSLFASVSFTLIVPGPPGGWFLPTDPSTGHAERSMCSDCGLRVARSAASPRVNTPPSLALSTFGVCGLYPT